MAEMMLVGRTHFVAGFFFLIAGYTAGLAVKSPDSEPDPVPAGKPL